jgi:hypothetical protein
MADAGFQKVKVWVEKHPFVTAGAVFVIGAVLIYLYYSGGSSAAQPAQQTSPLDAELQLQLQQQALAAQYGAQSGAQQTAAQISAQQGADQLSAVQSNNATQLGIAQLGATVSQAGITAQQQVQDAGIAAQTILGTQANATQDFLAAQNTTQSWNAEFAGLYNTYLNNSSPTATATAQLISKITPTVADNTNTSTGAAA